MYEESSMNESAFASRARYKGKQVENQAKEEAANPVNPNTSKGGRMDPGGFVKVKCIACGYPCEKFFINLFTILVQFKYLILTNSHALYIFVEETLVRLNNAIAHVSEPISFEKLLKSGHEVASEMVQEAMLVQQMERCKIDKASHRADGSRQMTQWIRRMRCKSGSKKPNKNRGVVVQTKKHVCRRWRQSIQAMVRKAAATNEHAGHVAAAMHRQARQHRGSQIFKIF
eukprot:Gb_37833 [translate_table: standard]